ncbi:MAG: hypothetical protein L3J56_09270, partial [Bacteroidales bacterium]|nr:hypothetical protein [Bacteroidales bacterium]
EKKYITAFLIASLILILQILFPYKINFSQFTFFDINNSEIYNKALFGYPFNIPINLIFLISFFPSIFYIKNDAFRKNFLILYITTFLIWLLFSYVIAYAPSYRYISFITPFTVLLIVGSFIFTIKVLYNKMFRVLLIALLLTSVTISFSNHYKSLYIENTYSPAKPSIAHKKVVDNFHKGDVIFKHWGPKLYLQGIPKDTKFLSLGGYQGKLFSEIFSDMKKNPSGWLIWHKYNEARLDPNFVNYANLYFKKYTGYGIDNTGEEVYYYNNSMLKPLELFQYQKYMPVANLCLKNSYSFVFDIKITENTKGSVFSFKNDTAGIVNCLSENKKIIIHTDGKNSLSADLQTDTINHIIWLAGNNKYTLYINGKKSDEEKISLKDDLVKFKINPAFNDYINNIRIYDFLLNKKQIQIINSDKNVSEESESDGKKFRTLFLWKRK